MMIKPLDAEYDRHGFLVSVSQDVPDIDDAANDRAAYEMGPSLFKSLQDRGPTVVEIERKRRPNFESFVAVGLPNPRIDFFYKLRLTAVQTRDVTRSILPSIELEWKYSRERDEYLAMKAHRAKPWYERAAAWLIRELKKGWPE